MSRHELEPLKYCTTCGDQLEARLEAVFEHWRNSTPCWHAALGRLDTTEGDVSFVTSWTAPCTDMYTVTVEYELSGDVAQERAVSPFGNGVSRVDVQTYLSVGDVTKTAIWETAGESNATEWFSMIPRLSDLKQDTVVNLFSAIVSHLSGVPVGEFVAKGVGVERNATEFEQSLSTEERTITVTFHAEEGHEYDLQNTSAAVYTVRIVNGESEGEISLTADIQGVQISHGAGPGTSGETTFRVMSTSEDDEFSYRFIVAGEAEKARLGPDETAADDEEQIEHNDDGTVTVTGSTGQGYGDAFTIRGTIESFERTGGESGIELYLDGEEITDEYIDDDGGESTFEIMSTSEDSEFSYWFTVDGDTEKTQLGKGGTAADDEEEIEHNDDGTVTVTGSTGQGYSDAFTISGDIESFQKNGW